MFSCNVEMILKYDYAKGQLNDPKQRNSAIHLWKRPLTSEINFVILIPISESIKTLTSCEKRPVVSALRDLKE